MASQLTVTLGFLSVRGHAALAWMCFSQSVHSLVCFFFFFLQGTRSCAGKKGGGMQYCTEESNHVHLCFPGDTLFLPCGAATVAVCV